MKPLSLSAMREDLWSDFQDVRSGKLDPSTATAGANIAGKILTSVRLNLLYCQMTHQTPNLKLLNG